METKIKVEIHKHSDYSNEILKIIGNHNSGKARIDLDVICGFLMAKKAMYPSDKLFIKTEGENGQTINISDDDGESFYLTITEEEIIDYPITDNYFKGNFCNECKQEIEPSNTLHFNTENKPVHEDCANRRKLLDISGEHFD